MSLSLAETKWNRGVKASGKDEGTVNCKYFDFCKVNDSIGVSEDETLGASYY
jgi:hypothetical protein